MYMNQEILDAARSAGASETFIDLMESAPDNHKAVQRLEYRYERGEIGTYPNSDFYAAIWNGDMIRAAEHADSENQKLL